MQAVPQIFDDKVFGLRQTRAAAPLFLNAEFEAALLDRINDVTRDFENVLVLGHDVSPALRKHPKIKKVVFRNPPHPNPLPQGERKYSYHALNIPLPLREGLGEGEKFDLIISAWELGFINDVPGHLAQIKHSLKPDGWLLAVFYGGESLIELRQILWQVDEEILRGVSPRVAPMIDLRDAAGLLQRANFALPVADSEIITIQYDNLFALMQELRRAGLANALTERRKNFTSKKYFMRAAEIYAEKYGLPNGKIPATAEIIFLSAWTPSENQQKAIMPGTATQRLADALNATEHRL